MDPTKCRIKDCTRLGDPQHHGLCPICWEKASQMYSQRQRGASCSPNTRKQRTFLPCSHYSETVQQVSYSQPQPYRADSTRVSSLLTVTHCTAPRRHLTSSNPQVTVTGSPSHHLNSSNPQTPQLQVQQQPQALSPELVASRDSLQHKLVIIGRKVVELQGVVKGLEGSKLLVHFVCFACVVVWLFSRLVLFV